MTKYLLLPLICMVSVSFGQTKSEKLDELMNRFHENSQFDGVVLVAERGKPVYEKAFGIADREWQIPNSLDTKFEIASITKTFTALLTMQLIESGRVKLDATIREYLKDYPTETGSKITVRQLLTHTSGIQRDIADFPASGNNFPDIAAKINEEFLSLEEQVSLIAKRPLLFEPGTGYSYSSDGYSVLGRIIEVVSNRSYEDVLHSMIILPLGLTNTGYKNHYTIIGKRASGYRQTYDGYEKGRQFGIAPSGGMFSTAGDLLKWDQALHSEKIISQKSKDIVFKKLPGITNYGWKVDENFFKAKDTDSVKAVKCTGGLPGFTSLVLRFLKDNKTIILLENVRAITYRHDEIAEAVARILYDKPYALPKKSFAHELLARVKGSGLPDALKLYEAFKENPSAYYLSESEINSVGYYLLLTLGKPDSAIAVFKINTSEFPKSANAFDSLGEAYMVKGDKANAIENYSQSLKLNPNNSNASEMLKKLGKN